jgi:preprotein translocase SecE subunit
MGREARRAQARAERRQKRQAKGGSRAPRNPASTASVAPAQPEQVRSRGSILKPAWITDIISELRKVTWPSRQEVGYLSFVVIVVSLIIGMILGAADLAFGWFVEQTILR